MPAKVFLDTKIWLYSLIKSDEGKYQRAIDVITGEEGIYSSVQVANEISINLIRKAGKDQTYIQNFLSEFMASYPVLAQEKEDLLTAAGLRLEYSLSYWDSLIVAVALRAGCKILYSEDMQHYLKIRGDLLIINPFLS
ncbi:PIN domain-containing protein [uncultured Thiothrix sp.]|uniref:PIN domain-containing protein n=1 Tax=uncultured Thiothrix sp. TaxID=223185 RepID=UPI002629FD3C|nr:PIN domain-containing protein [uncultured Thiothrix sp.]